MEYVESSGTWPSVGYNVSTLVSDAIGNVFALNFVDGHVYEYLWFRTHPSFDLVKSGRIERPVIFLRKSEPMLKERQSTN